jgi:hypothetical protein
MRYGQRMSAIAGVVWRYAPQMEGVRGVVMRYGQLGVEARARQLWGTAFS